jgi:Type IV secretion-system coupling protein DNA-binding domain
MLGFNAPATAGAFFAQAAICDPAARWRLLAQLLLASVQYAPAREVEHNGRVLLSGGLHLMLALLAGWMSARVIHALRLHWSWGMVAFAVCAGVCILHMGWLLAELPMLGALGAPGVLIAVLAATHLSRRWQSAEERSEGVAATLAVERVRPAEPLQRLRDAFLSLHSVRSFLRRPRTESAPRRLTRIRSWAGTRKRCARLIGRSAAIFSTRAEAAARRGRLPLGFTLRRSRTVSIPLGHTVVLGATGSGKTVTMRRILALATETMGVVAVDGKGDHELEHDLEHLARKTGRRFLAWSPAYATRYSPFSRGSDTEIVDKALAAESFGDDYYLRLGQRFLGFAVRALRAAGSPPTLSRLAVYVDPENLEQLAPAMEEANPGSWNELLDQIPRLDRGERQAIAGTQHRLATMAESDLGPLLEPASSCETIDLFEVVNNGDVAYFNLNADARPELARMVGAAVVMDLVSVDATMQSRDESTCGIAMPTVVLFDDVQAFASEAGMQGIASLSARGRSAGMMLLLGTQSISDLQLGRRGDIVDQLLDNRTSLIAHRLPGYGSAARASLELGDREVQRVTEHVGGGTGRWRSRGSATRTPAIGPNVPPRELMELPTGVAVVKTLGQPPCLVRVPAPR